MIRELITMDMPIEDVYYDYKLVADSIVDDESFQKADAGILLSNLYDAVKVLEKQIPKNLVCIEDKFLHCPCCDEALSYKWEKYPTETTNLEWLKFCWNCGQAIKWE